MRRTKGVRFRYDKPLRTVIIGYGMLMNVVYDLKKDYGFDFTRVYVTELSNWRFRVSIFPLRGYWGECKNER